MATARDHMTADMAWLFAQDGEEVVDATINSTPRRAIIGDETTGQYDDGSWYASREIIVQVAALVVAVPRQGINLDGVEYLIESVRTTADLLFLTLTRTVA
jgi:hypothetical protein